MIRGHRGITLLSTFLIVDCILIWWVNLDTRTTNFTAAPIATGDQSLVTLALIGAAVIAVLGAIMFKSKPIPARRR